MVSKANGLIAKYIIIHLDNDHYIIDRNYEPIEMKFDFNIYLRIFEPNF